MGERGFIHGPLSRGEVTDSVRLTAPSTSQASTIHHRQRQQRQCTDSRSQHRQPVTAGNVTLRSSRDPVMSKSSHSGVVFGEQDF